MGRAPSTGSGQAPGHRRERHDWLSADRRPAAPAPLSSSPSPSGFRVSGPARNWRAGVRTLCAVLAVLLVLLLGAGPALAHDAALGHVHLEDQARSGCSNGCPHIPTGYAQSGPGRGEITVRWTPATTGPATASW